MIQIAGTEEELVESRAYIWYYKTIKQKGGISIGDIYDGVFRTILNDCRQLVIPIINEIFHENYTGNEKIEFSSNEHFLAQQAGLEAEYKEILERLNALEDQGAIGTFEKRTIIELYRDVIKEIAQKYENIQKGVGGIMGGALIETEARMLRDEGRREGRQEGMVYAYYEMNMDTNEIASKVNLTETEVLEIINRKK
ncbi:MAG: hypothetical protein HFH66_06360 [Lachnospiraceae bacterium]|nr:hypothetical protein [Lachnospiraceae bacterium]